MWRMIDKMVFLEGVAIYGSTPLSTIVWEIGRGPGARETTHVELRYDE